MTTDRDETEFSALHTSPPTNHVLTELQLYGHRPFQDEPDPRPLPEANVIAGAVADIFDALIVTLRDTRIEPDLEDLLWSMVKLFRDVAADQFECHTGSPWRPRTGSMVNHRTLTAAMIDSRDFLAAKRRVETEPLLPAGPKIAFTGGVDFNDTQAIWDRLDKVRAKHPDMVLLHGGSPRGAERIAACWANSRKVPQIVFKPDWARHAKAAPFKRNDQILDMLPIGVIVFPGSGISANLADKAKRLGIPVWKFGGA